MIPEVFKEFTRSLRSQNKAVQCRRMSAQLKIPLSDELQIILTNRTFDSIFFLGQLVKLAGPVKEVRVLTWGLHEVGYEELLTLVSTVDLGSFVLKARPQTVKEVQPALESKGYQCQATKTRSNKLILVETLNKMFLSVITSAHPDGEEHKVMSDPKVYHELSKTFEES